MPAGDGRDTYLFLDSSGRGIKVARAVDHVIDAHLRDRNPRRQP
jgi:hypothetical protein